MKKIFSIFIFLLCAGTVFAANPPRVNKTLPFHKGINFTLWLDGNEPHRAANFGRQDFEDIRSLGVDCTRLFRMTKIKCRLSRKIRVQRI